MLGTLEDGILHRVCRQLCPHCRGYVVDADPRTPPSLMALRSLALTCSKLSKVALIYYYHRIERVRTLSGLLQSLVSRPDLAICVKQFYVPTGQWRHHEEWNRMTDMFPHLVAWRTRRPDHQQIAAPDQAILEEILLYMPMLEMCSVPFCRDDMDRPHRPFLHSPFLFLRALRVAMAANFVREIRRLRFLEMLSACPNLDWLMMEGSMSYANPAAAARPNPADFKLDHSVRPMSKLRTLQIEQFVILSSDAVPVLTAFIRSCPMLRFFRYAPIFSGYKSIKHIMRPGAMLSALTPAQETLTWLELDFSGLIRKYYDVFDKNIGLHLAAFTKLEVLILDERTLLHPRDWIRPLAICVGDCIVDILPVTVQGFIIITIGPDAHLDDDLITLAEAVRNGRFPCLRSIKIGYKPAQNAGEEATRREETKHLDNLMRQHFEGTLVSAETGMVPKSYGPKTFGHPRK
ncbi:hypothetical protein CDD83_10459 [Cordyceps sp. RAO-2017]|nr:hypothetical protein CDD83_10459 [Cordyceps sp. RAO-2017]